MIRAAPLIRAPWIAAVPMPPAPMTTTVSPARTFARFAAEPYPVGTAQDSSAVAPVAGGIDLDDRIRRNDSVFGERTDLREVTELAAVGGVVAERPVGRHARDS